MLSSALAGRPPVRAVDDAQFADDAIQRKVEGLMGPHRKGRTKYLAAMRLGNASACAPSASSCLCSDGCPTSWLGCRASSLCGLGENESIAAMRKPALRRAALLLYLTFSPKLVRNAFLHQPKRAFDREVSRVSHFLRSARRVNTTLPIFVVVAADHRDRAAEAALEALGARVLPAPVVAPPRWASPFHRLSFNRISALSFTQFDRVVVLDNDMVLGSNIDALGHAEAPGLVWHPACKWMLHCGEFAAVTGGLFVLAPSAAEHARALRHLDGMYARYSIHPNDSKAWTNDVNAQRPVCSLLGRSRYRYDGSDQEFWRSFYAFSRPYNLPIEFHATSWVRMPRAEWERVRVLHLISGFRPYDKNILSPTLRKLARHFSK